MSKPALSRVRRVPAREVAIPSSVSPAAQAFLAMEPREAPRFPAPEDLAGWRAFRAERNAAVLPMMQQRAADIPARVEEIEIDGARVFVVKPCGTLVNERAVFLKMHGGAFLVGGEECCRHRAVAKADALGAQVWAVDFRMPPEHPFPAALDDCLAAYRALLRERRPEEIIVGGGSTGANLAAALILRARDEGLPLPGAAVLLSPQLDLTESGDSFRMNMGVDPVLTTSLTPASRLYAGGHDLAHPYLSPLFGDFSKGFPPTLLSSGTRDLFLSDAVRMHRALRAARVPAELHVFEAAPHGLFPGAPEEEELDREVRRFAHCRWKAG